MTSISTKAGDSGKTTLANGVRLSKSHIRIEAYGAVDETNAAIGVARLKLPADQAAVAEMLERVQNDLFDIGADLEAADASAPQRLKAEQVARLEREIAALSAELPPLNAFILPGGTEGAAALHLARSICRRAERRIVELKDVQGEPVSDDILAYMNRLSDHLFVASRFVNGKGANDFVWKQHAAS